MSCKSRFNSGVKSVFGRLNHLSPAVAFFFYRTVSNRANRVLITNCGRVVKTQSNYDNVKLSVVQKGDQNGARTPLKIEIGIIFLIVGV